MSYSNSFEYKYVYFVVEVRVVNEVLLILITIVLIKLPLSFAAIVGLATAGAAIQYTKWLGC